MDVDAEAQQVAEIIRMTFEGNALQAAKEKWAAQRIAALVREAVAEEREACALAACNAQCNVFPEKSPSWDRGYIEAKRDASKAIRARKP